MTKTNPVLTIAGVMPAAPEMSQWTTAYSNPDAELGARIERPRGNRGPSLSMAGVMPGAPQVTHWNAPYPTGESIYVDALRIAERNAALAAGVVPLARRSRRPRLTTGHTRTAA